MVQFYKDSGMTKIKIGVTEVWYHEGDTNIHVHHITCHYSPCLFIRCGLHYHGDDTTHFNCGQQLLDPELQTETSLYTLLSADIVGAGASL